MADLQTTEDATPDILAKALSHGPGFIAYGVAPPNRAAAASAFAAWAPVYKASLAFVMLGTWLAIGYDDSFSHLVGGVIGLTGVAGLTFGLLAAAGIASSVPSPPTPSAHWPEGDLILGGAVLRRDPGTVVWGAAAVTAMLPVQSRWIVWAPAPGGVESARATGDVRWLVWPTVPSADEVAVWTAAFPEATAIVPGQGVGSAVPLPPDPGWPAEDGVATQVPTPRGPEIALFHAPSATLLLGGWLVNVGHDRAGLPWTTRAMMKLLAIDRRLTAPVDQRLGVQPTAALREAAAQISTWPFEHVVVKHGRPISSGARAAWRAATAWLD